MKYKKSAVLLLVINLLLLQNRPLKAQESMLEGFSYLYLEKLVAAAKENYPRVKSFESRVEIAKNNLTSQKISWLDPFSFSYIYRSNTTVIDVVSADLLRGYHVGVSLNPGVLLRKPSAVKSAKEELKISESERLEYDLQLESEVKRRYIAYLQSLNTLRLQSKAVFDAQNNFTDIRSRYERSEISFTDYNAASLSLNNALQSKIQAEGGLMSAKVYLEELLVKKLEDIK